MISRFTLAILIAAAVATSADAAWLAHGPYGGTVFGVVGSGDHLMVATSDGVYTSSDAGATWQHFGDLPRGTFVTWLVVSPADPAIGLAGGYMSHSYRTIDGGAHWEALATDFRVAFFHPLAPSWVVAIDANHEMLCSEDSGATFTDTGRSVASVVAYPNDVSFLVVDGQGEMLKTVPGCSSWIDIGHFNWSLLPGQMLFSPGDANTIFMSMNGLDQGQLARYDFSSNTITPLLYVYAAGGVRADPTTAGRFWFQGYSELDSHMHVWKSTDSGSTWLDLGGVLAFNVGLIGPDPSIAGRLYGNDDTGFAISDDAGSTWTSRTQGIPLAQTFAVSIRPDDPRHIVTTTQAGISVSTDGGATWNAALSPPPFTVIALARSPSAPTLIFAATSNRGVYRSTDDGDTWAQISDSDYLNFLSIIADRADPQKLAGAYGELQWSDDGGVHWRTAVIGTPGGYDDFRELIQAPSSGRIYALAFNHNDVYRLYRADAHGDVVVPVAGSIPLNALAVHPVDDRRLFAIAHDDAYLNATFYVSYDSGDHWAARGTVPNPSGAVLRFDPCNPDTIYLQTPNALYASRDEGMSWTAESLELPLFVVEDFDVGCVAGTLTMAAASWASGTEVREPQFIDDVFAGSFEGR